MMTREEAEKELIAMLEEAEGGPSYSIEEVDAYTARIEYVLYRWNDVFDNAEKIRSMVDRLRFQVECFNEALPYEAGQSYGDRAASQVRVIYRIS